MKNTIYSTLWNFYFDMHAICERAKNLNTNISIFPISAHIGESIDAWTNWLKAQVSEVKK